MSPQRGQEPTPEPRMPDPLYQYQETGMLSSYCQICGEHGDDEMGEFALPEGQTDPDGAVTIIAHGQCGLDHNLPIA